MISERTRGLIDSARVLTSFMHDAYTTQHYNINTPFFIIQSIIQVFTLLSSFFVTKIKGENEYDFFLFKCPFVLCCTMSCKSVKQFI